MSKKPIRNGVAVADVAVMELKSPSKSSQQQANLSVDDMSFPRIKGQEDEQDSALILGPVGSGSKIRRRDRKRDCGKS